jgi:hypothetical protein
LHFDRFGAGVKMADDSLLQLPEFFTKEVIEAMCVGGECNAPGIKREDIEAFLTFD